MVSVPRYVFYYSMIIPCFWTGSVELKNHIKALKNLNGTNMYSIYHGISMEIQGTLKNTMALP